MFGVIVTGQRRAWHEIFGDGGEPRPEVRAIWSAAQAMRPSERHNMMERLEATLRELGVAFGPAAGPESAAWNCDPVPTVIGAEDWGIIEKGVDQRLRAFDLFLQDLYSGKGILRRGMVPIQPVLGSPYYLPPAIGVPRPRGHFLHFVAVVLSRGPDGRWHVRGHHLSRAAGLSYAMQNRRALARVWPDVFTDMPVRSISAAPLAVLEHLRGLAEHDAAEPTTVVLTPGPGSPVYSDHSFLARRMGVPLVQGGDLLVLEDALYLKTVQGLKRVHLVLNFVAEQWLDPLVLRSEGVVGVPGLIHCVRRGSVQLVNALGSQLADDRSLLCYSNEIVRYFLGERAILPTVPTHWLGDIDQREMVVENLEAFKVKRVEGDDFAFAGPADNDVALALKKEATRYVAQPVEYLARSTRFAGRGRVECGSDVVVFALREGERFEVFPGGLNRLHGTAGKHRGARWTSRDVWVLGGPEEAGEPPQVPRPAEINPATRQVTSRVAEALYWLGRYLERAGHIAYLVQVVETLETEELNAAERRLYRPTWNRMLPPVEENGEPKRAVATRRDRYRLLAADGAGTARAAVVAAVRNAQSILEVLSPEAWQPIAELGARFDRAKYRENASEQEIARQTRRLSEACTRLIPQFFGTASNTMLGDDGWRFCEIGEMLERAILTANAMKSNAKVFTAGPVHHAEIELSALLRLLGTRDAFRRVYQTRAEPVSVLEFLWENPQAPRSVMRSLRRAGALLREAAPANAPGAQRALHGIEQLQHRILRVDWREFVPEESERGSASTRKPIEPVIREIAGALLDLHTLISDCFLNHQANIASAVQPMLRGFL